MVAANLDAEAADDPRMDDAPRNSVRPNLETGLGAVRTEPAARASVTSFIAVEEPEEAAKPVRRATLHLEQTKQDGDEYQLQLHELSHVADARSQGSHATLISDFEKGEW
jgi:hypothetical protein